MGDIKGVAFRRRSGDSSRINEDCSSVEKELEENISDLSLDNTWRCVGKFGRYQCLQLLLLSFGRFSAAWHMFSYIFIGYEPDHVCNGVVNKTEVIQRGINVSLLQEVSLEKCSMVFGNENQSAELPCIFGNNYSVSTSRSVLSEWDFVCSKRDTGQLPQSLILAGQGLGAILAVMADHIGRKKALIIGQVLMFAVSFSTAFVNNFWLFTTLRFFTGAAQQIIVMSSNVAVAELIPTDDRYKVAVLFGSIAWAVGLLTLTPIVYFLQSSSWRLQQIVLSFSTAHVLFVIFFMDESLRWLTVKRKSKDAVKLLKKICRINGVSFQSILDMFHLQRGAQPKSEIHHTDGVELKLLGKPASIKDKESRENERISTDSKVKASFQDKGDRQKIKADGNPDPVSRDGMIAFVTNARLIRQSLIVWFSWFVTVLAYYGLFLGPFPTVSDRFIQYTINAVVDLVSVIPKWYLLKNFTRRKVSIITNLVGGVALMLSSVLYSIDVIKAEASYVVTGFIVIGKTSINVVFVLWFLYTQELFPTNLRNTGLGVASFCGRVGGMIAPFSVTLANIVPWAPGVVFATGCLIVAFLMKFIPETSDKELPQNTKDLEKWSTDDASKV